MSSNSTNKYKTILIIEDDKTLNQLIIKELKDLDYNCKVAETISQGQKLLQQQEFDLLILDYKLPDGTIEDLIYQNNRELPPFIIITANGDQKLAVQMMKAGAKDYLVKDQSLIRLLPAIIKEIFKDIRMEEKLADMKQKLRKKEREYQFLFENAGVAMVIVNKSNEIELANNEMEKISNYSKKELETKGILDLLVLEESESKSISGNYNLNRIESHKYEGQIKGKEGNIKDVLIKRNSLSEKEWAIVSLIDITAKKDKEKELNQAYNRLNENINQAHKLHQNFLPANHFEKSEITGAAYYHPAQELGGDFYNYQLVNDKILLYLADVSGHGLDGALLNISVKEKINNLVTSYNYNGRSKEEYIQNEFLSLSLGNKSSPQEIMKSVFNSYLKEGFPDDYFLCLQIVLIDLTEEKLLYSNAGSQIVPYIINEKGDLTKLNNGELPISTAINKELMRFDEEEYYLEAGEKIFLSTDGLVEESNDSGYYGSNRVEELLKNYYYLAPEILKDVIRRDFFEFKSNSTTKDDVTFMVVERHPEIYEQYEIQSDFDELVGLEEEIMKFLVDSLEEANLMKMAVHEMLINAIEHGNKFADDKKVKIKISITDEYCRVLIIDQGSGFDYQSCFERGLYEDEGREKHDRGRGIVITAKIVDEICYNQLGNEVCLVKFRT
ncbi:MAG: SpoIIE family protein phosphatase [Halanaerobacter sp.]